MTDFILKNFFFFFSIITFYELFRPMPTEVNRFRHILFVKIKSFECGILVTAGNYDTDAKGNKRQTITYVQEKLQPKSER